MEEKVKTFEGYIVLNIRDGTARVVKKLPNRELLAAEVGVHYKINCLIPKQVIGEITGEVVLTDKQFTGFVLNQLEDNENG